MGETKCPCKECASPSTLLLRSGPFFGEKKCRCKECTSPSTLFLRSGPFFGEKKCPCKGCTCPSTLLLRSGRCWDGSRASGIAKNNEQPINYLINPINYFPRNFPINPLKGPYISPRGRRHGAALYNHYIPMMGRALLYKIWHRGKGCMPTTGGPAKVHRVPLKG